MLNRLSRKISAAVLIPLVLIGMTSLGMRLPSIAGFSSGGPKPRPRAVLQTQVKKCKDQINKHAPDVGATEIQALLISSCSFLPIVTTLEFLRPLILSISKSSRAPPLTQV